MITTKELKIRRPKVFDSALIESELKEEGYNVLRWAITDADDETYTLSISVVED